MPRGSGWRYVDQGWWPELLHGLIPLLILAAVIGFGVWAVLRLTQRPPIAAIEGPGPLTRTDDAIEEVRLRYARGEMGRDEFLQRSRDLGGEGAPPVPGAPQDPPQPARDPQA